MATKQFATSYMTPPGSRSRKAVDPDPPAEEYTPAADHPWKSTPALPTGTRQKRKGKPKTDRPYHRLGPVAKALVDRQVAELLALAAARKAEREEPGP